MNGATGLRERVRHLLVWAMLAIGPVMVGPVAAQQPADGLSSEPILRIETGKHVASIRRIDTDASNRFVVTASNDKTARVWSLPDGRLQKILRLPIDQGDIGKAYSVAISPDGSTIAVGGWTGPRGHLNIFLFDRVSGELKQRLADLPNVTLHLAYSLDGRRLVALLGGKNGIRVFDAENGYRPLESDTQYGDSSYRAAFDPLGRLVTTSYDGFVRLYVADHYDTPIARFETKGNQPFAVAFSPKGDSIAVGYYDTNDVVVLSGVDLKQKFKPNTQGGPNGGFSSVEWSTDGRFLYAGGLFYIQSVCQVRRWSDGGRGAYTDIPVALCSIMQIRGLKDGRMLFASTGSFAVIQADAKPIELQRFGVLDLRSGGEKKLGISQSGDTVRVDARDPPHTYRFNLGRRQIDIDPAMDGSLLAPMTEAPGLSIKNWLNSTAPTVNDTPLKLGPWSNQEASRSYRVAIISCLGPTGTYGCSIGRDVKFGLPDLSPA